MIGCLRKFIREQLQVLIEEYWNKDKDWFDNSFRRYYQRLCYFALQYIKDRDTVEDVVQGVFIRLLDSGETWESEEHFKHYLYRAVRNACLNEIKLGMIHSDILGKIQGQQGIQQEENFFWQIVRTEIYQKIEKAVSELPAECGRIFRMAYIEHFENPEIADQLQISINTVKVQKNRAKHMLREKLKDLYPLLVLLAGI